MLSELPLHIFLDRLASGDAAPGGGTAAAWAGAQGAALLSMVCRLTIGREDCKEVEEEMRAFLEQTEALRARLLDLMEADAHAFDGVMAAYKLPRTSPTEKAARSAAIQAALQAATITPLDTLAACVEVLALAPRLLDVGNPNVISDGAGGVLSAHAGMTIAAANVRINLNAIKDQAFVSASDTRMRELRAQGDDARDRAWQIVCKRLGID